MKKSLLLFTDEEKRKQSEAEYAEVIRERDNLISDHFQAESPRRNWPDKIRTVYITEETAALAGYMKRN